MEVYGIWFSYFVEGMDCVNCVVWVEKMVGGLFGMGEVKISFIWQMFMLEFDEIQMFCVVLEKNLCSLGYGLLLLLDWDVLQMGEGVYIYDYVDYQYVGYSYSYDFVEQGKFWYCIGQG